MIRRAILVAAILALAACAGLVAPTVDTAPSALRSGEYGLDKDHASLVFKIGHLGFSTYVGRFEKFDASLDFDERAPEAARVEAVIDITSLDVANDDFAETLKGPGWFDADRFPDAVFRSTAIEATGENTGVMAGNLTIRGVTRPVSLAVTFNGGARDILRGAYVVGFSAQGTIDRREFGISRFSGVIADSVEIEIEAEFLRN